MFCRSAGSTWRPSLTCMSYDDTADFKNLLEAGLDCCKSGRWKAATQQFEIDILQRTAENRKRLQEGAFKPKPTNDFTLCERGKARTIRAHHITDRQAYKSFVRNELIPATEHLVMENNSASQQGKGTEHAIKAFRRALARAYKKYGRRFYVWTYDFSNYFGSIPHEGGIQAMRVADPRSQQLLRQYANLFDEGFGIGGEPSQRVAVVYPAPIDGMIAATKGVLDSGRYMDDGWAISGNRDVLVDLNERFSRKAAAMGLTVNKKHTGITCMEHGSVTFLKKRTSISETGRIVMKLDRRNVRDALRRIKWQKAALDAGEMPMEAIVQSFECWCAYARKIDGNKQALRVANVWAETFGVPWEEALRAVNGKRIRWTTL